MTTFAASEIIEVVSRSVGRLYRRCIGLRQVGSQNGKSKVKSKALVQKRLQNSCKVERAESYIRHIELPHRSCPWVILNITPTGAPEGNKEYNNGHDDSVCPLYSHLMTARTARPADAPVLYFAPKKIVTILKYSSGEVKQDPRIGRGIKIQSKTRPFLFVFYA